MKLYQNWSPKKGDYINNQKKLAKEELVSRRKRILKRGITIAVIYIGAVIIYFFIFKWF